MINERHIVKQTQLQTQRQGQSLGQREKDRGTNKRDCERGKVDKLQK